MKQLNRFIPYAISMFELGFTAILVSIGYPINVIQKKIIERV